MAIDGHGCRLHDEIPCAVFRNFRRMTFNALSRAHASSSMLIVVNACDKACVYRGWEQAQTDTEDRRLSATKTVKMKCSSFYIWNNCFILGSKKENSPGLMGHDVMAGRECSSPFSVFELSLN